MKTNLRFKVVLVSLFLSATANATSFIACSVGSEIKSEGQTDEIGHTLGVRTKWTVNGIYVNAKTGQIQKMELASGEYISDDYQSGGAFESSGALEELRETGVCPASK